MPDPLDELITESRREEAAAERLVRDADGCPFCGWPETRVVDTKRPRRRRECQNLACKRRYNTREVIDAA